MRSSWMKVGTTPGVLTQDRTGEDAQRQRPCDSRGRDWHLDCKPSPDARVILPHRPQKESTLPTPGSWGSGLQSCGNKFPLFQTTHMRSFVTASIGHSAPPFPQKHPLSLITHGPLTLAPVPSSQSSPQSWCMVHPGSSENAHE